MDIFGCLVAGGYSGWKRPKGVNFMRYANRSKNDKSGTKGLKKLKTLRIPERLKKLKSLNFYGI